MKRMISGAALAGFSVCAAFAQPAEAPLAFEVASVKSAPPMTGGAIRIMQRNDPGMINYSGMSLKDLVRVAYQVKDYQVMGPDWMGSERFDIVAKLPSGATREQVPAMLQALLAERFKVTIHREKKELPAYVLVVAKNGPKLKASVDNADAPPDGKTPQGKGPEVKAMPPGVGFGAGDSFAVGGLRGGKAGIALPSGGRAMMMMGRGRLSAKKMDLPGLCDMLSRQVDRPVFDETGIAGTYDFDLNWTPDESAPGPRIFQGPGGAAGGEGGVASSGGGDGHIPSAGNPDVQAPPLGIALQQQLGLKLDAKKAPLDLIVVDHAEKVPTEN